MLQFPCLKHGDDNTVPHFRGIAKLNLLVFVSCSDSIVREKQSQKLLILPVWSANSSLANASLFPRVYFLELLSSLELNVLGDKPAPVYAYLAISFWIDFYSIYMLPWLIHKPAFLQHDW